MNTWLNIRYLGCVLLLVGVCSVGYPQHKLPETHYKYRVTKKVFQDLINVFASSRGRPALEIIAKGKKNPVIALYVSQPISVVKIDEELYDLCQQLGKDSLAALAGVLGHELSHYYLQHAYSNSFGTNLLRPTISQEDLQQIESSADKTSVFFSTLAGYETVRVFPVVMDKIYQYYNRPSQLAGYPSLQERKNIYRQLSLQVRHRIAVFQAGQFLYSIQNFESAALCFKDLLNDFPSREMHNNLASARLQQVLRLLNPNEHPFKYPVEFDYTSRLETFSRAPQNRTAEFLQEAIGALTKAIELDPAYVPAHVNLACAYVLQGNYYKAIGEIDELKKANLSADARTIQAIAFHKINDRVNAKKNFEAAVQLKGFQADYNLSAYKKLVQGAAPEVVRAPGPAMAVNEKKTIPVSEATPQYFADATTPDTTIKISSDPYLSLKVTNQADAIKILGIRAPGPNATRYTYQVAVIQAPYPGQTAHGIRLGSSENEVKRLYGTPQYSYSGLNRSVWVYKKQGIGFAISNGQVKSWFVFESKKMDE